MIYCEAGKKEVRNDKWRANVISENHLVIELKRYCRVCKTEYDVLGYSGETLRDKCWSAENIHIKNSTHKKNQERFDCYSC